MWIDGFMNALSGMNIFWLMVGSVIGLVAGILPALGATFGVVLVLPFTYGMDPAAAIILLVAIHAACNYGDSVTSIFLNIPGGPGTIATCWDGYPLAQQGRGGEALGIATFSSFIGGFTVWLMLAFLVKPITKLALAFGAPEYFALIFMALGLVSVAAKGETIKGIIMACMGLMVSAVGQDEVLGGTFRFTYGIRWLESGFPLVATALGMFAIPQVIEMLEEGGTVAKCLEAKDSIWKGFYTSIRRPLTLLRAGGIGAFIGVLPALGVTLAGIAAYLTEKKYSKEASEFGKGAPAGLVAAEVGKGACVVGDLIPTFTLGVPGSVTGAIIMAALVMKGIEPGPKFLLSGSLPYTIFAGMLLAQATFLIMGLTIGKQMCRVAFIPTIFLAPILVVLVFLGAYSTQGSTYDILISLVFGLFAYALTRIGYPVVCLVLGIILGPLLEANFHRSLAQSFGSYGVFLTRPLSAGMILITIFFLLWPSLMLLYRRYRRKSAGFVEEALGGSRVIHGYKRELILLLIVAFIFVTLLYTACGYGPLVRLFPIIISVAGLGFTVWRFLIIIIQVFTDRSQSGVPSAPSPRFSFFQGRLSWQWGIASLMSYMFSIYVFGFLASSILYIIGVLIIAKGYQSWKTAILTGILVGLGVLLLSKVAHLPLPVGMLTGV